VKLTSVVGPRWFEGENTTEIRFLNLAVAEFVPTLVVPEREMSGGNVYNYWRDVRLVIPRTSCQTSLSLCHVMTNASAVSQSVTSCDVVTCDWWGSACAAFQCNIPLT